MNDIGNTIWRERIFFSAVGCLIVGSLLTQMLHGPFVSSEARFVEVSSSGLQIIPASCPSDPSNSDYPHNSCSGSCPNGLDITQYPTCICPPGDTFVAGGGSGGAPASCVEPTVTPDSGSCVIIANPNPKYYSQSTTLSWSVGTYSYTDPTWGTVQSLPPSNIMISPTVGSVGSSGTASVNPTNYTTYTLTADYVANVCILGFYCSDVVVANANCSRGVGVYYCPSGESWNGTQCQNPCSGGQTWDGAQCSCPAGTSWDGGQCVSVGQCTSQFFCSGSDRTGDGIGDDRWWRDAQCSENFSEACTYGCYNGQCLAAPMGTIDIRVSPSLVRTGLTTTVRWTAESVSSCYVDENNPAISDSWSDGAMGCDGSRCESSHISSEITQQTRYTLHCTGLDGETYTDAATVNILPVFNEI